MTDDQCGWLYRDLQMERMPEPWVDVKHPLWKLWCDYCHFNELEW
jgi:hypothetical protein